MESARTSTVPVSSSSLCPACQRPVDTLRAGHVAILDGAFRYFCAAPCKDAYVDAASKRAALDALTAEPPAVALVLDELRGAGSGRREGGGEPRPDLPPSAPGPEPARASAVERAAALEPAAPAEAPPARKLPEVALPPPARPPAAPEPDEAPALRDGGAPPSLAGEEPAPTLRSPDVAPDEVARASEARAPRERSAPFAPLAAAVPLAGAFAGAFAAVVSLAGDAATVLRLPLALAAALVLFARKGLGRRESSEPSAWVVVGPVLLAACVAIASASLGHEHMDAHASFVGLAAASALTVDLLLARARRDVLAMRSRTTAMLDLRARVVRGEVIADVDASEVKPGEQVVVEAGEVVPVDGVVAAGQAEVAPWLDSPVLVRKSEGGAVVAGAAVVSGRLRVNTTFSGSERAWLRLLQPGAGGAAAASARIDVSAPFVAFVRRVVERASPVAGLLVAGAVFADNGSWFDVVLAGCGGAYMLAAASAVAGAALAHGRGHAAALRRGIVHRDAGAFDTAARADVAVVCSRGTILLGEPEIVAVESLAKDGASDPDGVGRVLAIAAGAETSSTHPFAAAILREARARGVTPDDVRSSLVHAGLGVTAIASSGDRVIVGSRAFLLKEKVSVALADARTSELEAQGRSVLLVAAAGRLVGLLALQDGIRPGARAAVQRLHDARIEPVFLSGEARDTCETIARALDIEHVRPEILPDDRGAEVRSLAGGGRVVAAIGHASSDGGALGAADVSIALSAAGAAPGEWGVTLASDDMRDAALALTIPRVSRDRARTAALVGALAQALGVFGIAFGVATPAVVPVFGLLAAAAVVSAVREPSQT